MGRAYKCDRCGVLTQQIQFQPFPTQFFQTSNKYTQYGIWDEIEDPGLGEVPHHAQARIFIHNRGAYEEDGHQIVGEYCYFCFWEMAGMVGQILVDLSKEYMSGDHRTMEAKKRDN